MLNLAVQRIARVLALDGDDVMIGPSILVMQSHHRHADYREDETQTSNVLAQFACERVIVGG